MSIPQPILVCVAALAAWLILLRMVLGYRLGEEQVEILLFDSLAVCRLPYAQIVEVRPATTHELWGPFRGFGIKRCANRPWGPAVFIRVQGKRWCRYILTPDDVDQFIFEVRRHLAGH